MNEQELKRASKLQLLQMLQIQTKRVEELEAEIENLKKQLQSREILLNKAGNIAKASLELNQVFESAQSAADLYLENIRRLYHEAKEMAKETKDAL